MRGRWRRVVGVAAAVLVVTGVAGCGSSTDRAAGLYDGSAVNPTPDSVANSTETPLQKLQAAVKASDVESGHAARSARGIYTVKFNVKDNLTQGMIRGGMAMDTFSVLQHVYASGVPFKRLAIEGTGKVQDKYGNESTAVVYRAVFTHATAARINFSNIDTTSLTLVKELAESTYVLPDLDG